MYKWVQTPERGTPISMWGKMQGGVFQRVGMGGLHLRFLSLVSLVHSRIIPCGKEQAVKSEWTRAIPCGKEQARLTHHSVWKLAGRSVPEGGGAPDGPSPPPSSVTSVRARGMSSQHLGGRGQLATGRCGARHT